MEISKGQKEALYSVFEEHSFLGKTGDKYVFGDGQKTAAIKTFLKRLGYPESFMTPDLSLLGFQCQDGKTLPKAMLASIDEWTEANKAETQLPRLELKETEEGLEAQELSSYIKTLVPVVNVGQVASAKNKVILLDPHRDNRVAIEIDTDAYLSLVGTSYQALIANPQVMKVLTCFDPYTLDSIIIKRPKSGEKATHHVNYYVPPRWRFIKSKPAFTGFIKGLINHLFVNESEKEYVLDWLHYALVKRNETVLCLIGARGTGKGILLNNILEKLLGHEYHEVAKQEVLTDKFNPEFKNKRHVYFDEVDISGNREVTRFKALANHKISLEAKGVDAETIDNHASMSLTSNSTKDFRVEPQDRRFSVPEVTEVPLLKLYTEDEISQFLKRIESPESEEIAEFGNFLLNRLPKNSNQTPLRGRYYFNLCRLSMSEWKIFIIDYFINHGEAGKVVSGTVLKKLFIRMHGEDVPFVSRQGTVESFLGDYIHEGVCKIGKVVEVVDHQRGRNTYGICPSDEFINTFSRKERDNALEGL